MKSKTQSQKEVVGERRKIFCHSWLEGSHYFIILLWIAVLCSGYQTKSSPNVFKCNLRTISYLLSGINRLKFHYPMHRKVPTFSKIIHTCINTCRCQYLHLINDLHMKHSISCKTDTKFLLLHKYSTLMLLRALCSTCVCSDTEKWSNLVGGSFRLKGLTEMQKWENTRSAPEKIPDLLCKN